MGGKKAVPEKGPKIFLEVKRLRMGGNAKAALCRKTTRIGKEGWFSGATGRPVKGPRRSNEQALVVSE